MNWIIYQIDRIPDLELNKYQSLGEHGVEGVIKCHNTFLRQWQRNSQLLNNGIHYYMAYSPDKREGQRISLFLCISTDDSTEESSIDAMIMASALSNYYSFKKISEIPEELKKRYPHMTVLKKQERKNQTGQSSLYTVHGWKSNENARLYEMTKIMQALKSSAIYCVSIYGTNAYETVSSALEKPISYLRKRTLGSKDNSQVSLSENRYNFPRDFAAEETLKHYEEFLREITKSPCFKVNIRVLSEHSNISRLIIDAACGESIEEGDCDVVTYCDEDFMPLCKDNIPQKYASTMPETLKFWPTLFTIEEVSPFFRFPILYDGENIEIQKETYPVLESGGLLLGKTVQGYDTFVNPVLLSKHAFICGVPGSGKTNTMLHLADSLWHNKMYQDGKEIDDPIPFMVLEPAKREYRELSQFDIQDLIIFSPSANTRFPIRLNPFEFPIGLTLSEHISKLSQVFEGAFPIAPPAPFILDRAIENIYIKHGWSTRDINMGIKEYPTTSELYEQFESELQNTTYDAEIRGNIRSVLEMRIGSLLRREMKDIFDVSKSTFSPEEWLRYPVVIELESLGEGPANFVTLLLCTLIRETLKVSPMGDIEKPLRHVIFIEEAHNLIAPQAQVDKGDDSNPKIAATAYIVKMLAEVRALREGIVIADQLPSAMAPEIIKNTNIKLVHRLTSGDDRELIGSTMAASGLQLERVATYRPGEALMSFEGLLRPFEMRVTELPNHGTNTPNDDELFDLMIQKPAFNSLFKMNHKQLWSDLKDKVSSLIKKEEMALYELANYSFSGKNASQIQTMLEDLEELYQNIRIIRYQYCNQCEAISDSVIENSKKRALKELTASIGENLYKQLRQTLQFCVETGLL